MFLGPIGTLDLQTFMHIVLHVVGHADSLSSQQVSHLMQKPTPTHCHNISRPLRQMNPQFEKTKASWWLVCGFQPSQVDRIVLS